MKDDRAGNASWLRLAAFALPAAPLAALSVPLNVYLPAFYVRDLGLNLAVVGAIFLFSRLLDIFIDPMIGRLSDSTNSAFGRRRPWMVAALPVLVLFTWVLFMPGSLASPVQLAVCLVGVYAGFAMLAIPHLSWSAELAGTNQDRFRVQQFIAALTALGVVVGLGAPALAAGLGMSHVSPETSIAAFIIIATPLSVGAALLSMKTESAAGQRSGGLLNLLGQVRRSRKLSSILICDLAYGLAIGMTATLFVFFLEGVLALPSSTLPLILFYGAAILSTPAWLWLARRMPSPGLAALSSVLSVVATLNWVVIALASRHLADVTWWVSAQMTVFGLVGGNLYAVLRSLMAQYANEQAHQLGQIQTGAAYALLSATGKLGLALATGVGLMVLGAFRVDVANIPVEDWPIFFGLFTGVPGAAFALIGLVMVGYPDSQEPDPRSA